MELVIDKLGKRETKAALKGAQMELECIEGSVLFVAGTRSGADSVDSELKHWLNSYDKKVYTIRELIKRAEELGVKGVDFEFLNRIYSGPTHIQRRFQ